MQVEREVVLHKVCKVWYIGVVSACPGLSFFVPKSLWTTMVIVVQASLKLTAGRVM